jgi:predicted RND superfamily exporter protein
MPDSDRLSSQNERKQAASPPGMQHGRTKPKLERSAHAMSRSTFVVLLIISLVILLQTYGQLRIQQRNNDVLKTQFSQQKQAFDEAVKVRQQLEVIAGETARLADQGNANAMRIRAALQEQGINISAPKD